jgi:uncharacterized Zn finger protein
MEELKPCPFCGGAAEFVVEANFTRSSTRGWEFTIECSKCGVRSKNKLYTLEL